MISCFPQLDAYFQAQTNKTLRKARHLTDPFQRLAVPITSAHTVSQEGCNAVDIS